MRYSERNMFRVALPIALAAAIAFGSGACRKDPSAGLPVPPTDSQAELEAEGDPRDAGEVEIPADPDNFPTEDAMPDLTEPEPEPEPEPAEPSDLNLADIEFERGNLEAAVHLYDTALNAPEISGQDRAHALLRSAVAYLLPNSPFHDPEQGKKRMETLVEEFPESPLALEASVILILMEERSRLQSRTRGQARQIEELNQQLDALKRIDLRRPPN
jgi:hypothetical protein